MENALEIRDIVFWWLGCWSVITAVDGILALAVLAVIRSKNLRRNKRQHGRENGQGGSV